jgi:hypothetical protein
VENVTEKILPERKKVSGTFFIPDGLTRRREGREKTKTQIVHENKTTVAVSGEIYRFAWQ